MEQAKIHRLWNAENIEEYVISVCLHNKEALAKSMSSLVGVRDFKNPANRDAFAIIEMRYEKGKSLDPIVIMDEWIDLDIYNPGQAKAVAGAWDGDTDYEPKIKELAILGGRRKAKKDIEQLWDVAKTDIDVEQLSKKLMDTAVSWITGSQKKYSTGAEIDEMVRKGDKGRKLKQGIPILDDVLYKNAGQHTGTVKATVFREKHGKTRHACWEAAQDLRQGHKVLYVTLEGSARDITGNMKQILKDEWEKYNENVFLKDGTVNSDDIQSAIIEAVFTEKIDKVVIDYLHIMEQPDRKYLSENENSNRCCQQMTRLAVKYDFNLHILNQARQSQRHDTKYDRTPKVYDCYGSNQLIKDASIILVGIRSKNYEDLILEPPSPSLGLSVEDPDGNRAPFNSVFIKPILSRQKLECQHKWLHMIDTDSGLTIHRNELL